MKMMSLIVKDVKILLSVTHPAKENITVDIAGEFFVQNAYQKLCQVALIEEQSGSAK